MPHPEPPCLAPGALQVVDESCACRAQDEDEDLPCERTPCYFEPVRHSLASRGRQPGRQAGRQAGSVICVADTWPVGLWM